MVYRVECFRKIHDKVVCLPANFHVLHQIFHKLQQLGLTGSVFPKAMLLGYYIINTSGAIRSFACPVDWLVSVLCWGLKQSSIGVVHESADRSGRVDVDQSTPFRSKTVRLFGFPQMAQYQWVPESSSFRWS